VSGLLFFFRALLGVYAEKSLVIANQFVSSPLGQREAVSFPAL
jgi:hypothetical protein